MQEQARVDLAGVEPMGSVREETFDDVVQRFYEAAAMPEFWPDALHALALACDSGGSIIIPVNGISPMTFMASEGIAGEVQEGLISGWLSPERNSRMQRGVALYQRGWRGIITEND